MHKLKVSNIRLKVNDEMEGMKKESTVAFLRQSSSICLEELRKITKTFSPNILSLCHDWNIGPPKYEVGVVTTQLRSSVSYPEYDAKWAFIPSLTWN